jgi:hypothetical protein
MSYENKMKSLQKCHSNNEPHTGNIHSNSRRFLGIENIQEQKAEQEEDEDSDIRQSNRLVVDRRMSS